MIISIKVLLEYYRNLSERAKIKRRNYANTRKENAKKINRKKKSLKNYYYRRKNC